MFEKLLKMLKNLNMKGLELRSNLLKNIHVNEIMEGSKKQYPNVDNYL